MRDDLHHRETFRQREGLLSLVGSGALRVALLFGTAGVGMALILTPLAEKQTRPVASAVGTHLDPMATGSIPSGNDYTLRRSVLQPSPNAVCVIEGESKHAGDC